MKYVTDPLELRERYGGTFCDMEDDFTLDVEEDEVVVVAVGLFFLGVAVLVLVDVAGVVAEDDCSGTSCFVGGEFVFMLATLVAVTVVAAIVVLSTVDSFLLAATVEALLVVVIAAVVFINEDEIGNAATAAAAGSFLGSAVLGTG